MGGKDRVKINAVNTHDSNIQIFENKEIIFRFQKATATSKYDTKYDLLYKKIDLENMKIKKI